jgi:hypothetical protein
MSKVLYKAGYLIRVLSWENDADNYNNEEIQVETEQDAKDLVDFCWLFKSRYRDKGGIGNIYEARGDDQERELEVYKKFLEEHPNFCYPGFDPVGNPGDDELVDYMHEAGYDLGLTSGEQYTRVCDKVEVLFFKEDVICEEINL